MLVIIGFMFMILMFALAGGLVDTYLYLIDTPSLLVVLLPLVFFLFATKSGKIISGYIGASFKKDYEYSKAELESIATAVKGVIKITLAAGGFGVLVGLIASLANAGTPGMLAPNLAVSLITLMYSIAISFFVFFPVQAWAENKIRTGA